VKRAGQDFPGLEIVYAKAERIWNMFGFTKFSHGSRR
jgi:hypothetical protein